MFQGAKTKKSESQKHLQTVLPSFKEFFASNLLVEVLINHNLNVEEYESNVCFEILIDYQTLKFIEKKILFILPLI